MEKTQCYIEDNQKGYFYKLDRNFITNKNSSSLLKGILPQIFIYSRQHPDTIMTKKLCMELTGDSERVIDKVYAEAEELGYLHSIKTNNKHIQYIWYENPKLNPYYTGNPITVEETEKEVDKVCEQIKQCLDTKIDVSNLSLAEKRKVFWQHANEKFNKSIFSNDPKDKKDIPINMTKDMQEYMQDHFDTEHLISFESTDTELTEECWKLIMRSTSNTQKTFESFMENDYSKETLQYNASIMRGLILRGTRIYKEYKSHITIIRDQSQYSNEIDYSKLLFIKFTQVIANYIRLKHYIVDDNGNRRAPTIEELKDLYYSLESHPELMYLENSIDGYELFNYNLTEETARRDGRRNPEGLDD